MKLGSLFDGSGTCPLTAQMCGIEPVWASEIEPFPIAVTRSRFPDMKHLGDIMKINGGEIEPVDVITFGSPCQNLSIAGNRDGLTGSESSLFLEAIRVIREMLIATNGEFPKIAVWENVPGAFSSNKGEDFRRVLEEFCKIKDCDTVIPGPPKGKWSDAGEIVGDGYSLAWRVFDAQFWGVPQRCRRIYLVCDLRGGRAGEILFERGGLSRDFKTCRGNRETVAGDTGESAEQQHSYYAVESHPQDKRVSLAGDNIIQTLACRMGTEGGNVPLVIEGIDNSQMVDVKNGRITGKQSMTICAARSDCHKIPCAIIPFRLRVLECLRVSPPIYLESDTASTMAARDYKSPRDLIVEPFIVREKDYHGYENAEVCNVLKASDGNCGPGSESLCLCPIVLRMRCGKEGGGKGALIQKNQSGTLIAQNDQSLFLPYMAGDSILYLVRRLTPTECASLQGFPKDWCALVPHKDAPEYKMWGNGMALPCMLYVMEGIAEVLKDDET